MKNTMLASFTCILAILLLIQPMNPRLVNNAMTGLEIGVHNLLIIVTPQSSSLEPGRWMRFLPKVEENNSEIAKIYASDSQSNDYFGVSVAASGDTIVVGAYTEDGGLGDPIPSAGAAYVFERDLGGPGNWGEAAKLMASDAQAGDEFGKSVSIFGDTIVIGADKEDGGPGDPSPNAGAVYIFERNFGGTGNWGESNKLTYAGVQAHGRFGASVAINGDTIVVGAWGVQSPENFLFTIGAAYVFERDLGGPGTWGESNNLFASDAQDDDAFGISVGVSDDTIVVGAWLEDGGPGDPRPNSGSAYVYDRDLGGPGNWGEATKLVASDSQTEDIFGNSVAIDGNTIVVGAWLENGGPGDPLPAAGAVYIFERNLGGLNSWGEAAKLVAGDAQASATFGYSVAISGNQILVGSIGEDGSPANPATYAGAAYVFERNLGGSGNWGEHTRLSASDAQFVDHFGSSVAISNGIIVVGAIEEDGGPGDPLPDAGAAYVFQSDYQIFIPFTVRE